MVSPRTSIHERFLAAWKRGLGQSAIAREISVSRQRCAELHKLNGVEPHGGRRERAEKVRQRRSEVRKLHGRGLSHVAVSKRLGVPASTVQSDLSAMGLTTTSSAVAQRRACVAELVALCLTGPEIAKCLGIRTTTVAADVAVLGLSLRGRCRKTASAQAARRLAVKAMLEKGMTGAAIARELHASIGTLTQDKRSLGIQIKSRGRRLTRKRRLSSPR